MFFQEASVVLKDHLLDKEEAVSVLVKGGCWSEASLLIRLMNRPDLEETLLIPALDESAETAIQNLRNQRQTFKESFDRLQVVYEFKRKMASGDGGLDQEDIEEGFGAANDGDADLYSDTTSQAALSQVSRGQKTNPMSLMTKTSNRSKKSSKNRRKHERKTYSTKTGSTYEDLGLIALLHQTLTRFYSLAEEIGSLNRALVRAGKAEVAKTLQEEMSEALVGAESKQALIWIGGNKPEEEETRFGPNATTADIILKTQEKVEYVPSYHMLEIRLRFPPSKPIRLNDYKLEMLS